MQSRGKNNREVKHDVYGKRQTAKMKLLPSLFSCMYSRVKLFVFAMNSRRRYSIFVCFIYGLEENNSKSEVIFAVCRLPLTSCLTSLISHSFAALAREMFLFPLEIKIHIFSPPCNILCNFGLET